MGMQSIYNLSLSDLRQYFIDKGEKPYRAIQIFEWLYRFQIRSFEQMTNQKKSIIELLNNEFSLDLLELKERQISSDTTEKFYLNLKMEV
jgi:23S rRNA (adenine2503-C2)-methyltransferase